MADPAPPGRPRALELLALAAIVCAAWFLRASDIESFRIGPDDGSYLHSARVHELQRGGNPFRWIADDARWVGELADNYTDDVATYQHSYLHQLAARWLYRMGAGALQSLRLSSAILGTLSVVIVWLLVRALAPRRRSWALLAAAILALAPQHVWLSRTGWGQVGFTCWYLAFLAIAHRVLVAEVEPSRGTLVRSALGLALTSVLAFGWQEGVGPYVAGTAVVAFLAPWVRGERWSLRAVLRSGRTWAYVAGAALVGLFTVALMLWSPFAQKAWFAQGGPGGAGLSWLDVKRLSLENLVVAQRPDLIVGWPLLVLAGIGFVWLARTAKTSARWIALNALAGALLLFVFFRDPYLMRIYLPSFVLVYVLAAAGVVALAQRFGALLGALTGAALVAWLAATSWSTLFGRHLGFLYVQKLYDQRNELDHRHVDGALYGFLLAELRPGDRVVAFGEKGPVFKLLDRGVIAREDYLEGPRETWPRWIVGARNVFERSPFYAGNGGPYVARVRDNVDRHVLYELAPK